MRCVPSRISTASVREQLAGQYRIESSTSQTSQSWLEETTFSRTADVGSKLPTPIRKIIGDLSDTDKVLVGLEIVPDLRAVTLRGVPISSAPS